MKTDKTDYAAALEYSSYILSDVNDEDERNLAICYRELRELVKGYLEVDHRPYAERADYLEALHAVIGEE